MFRHCLTLCLVLAAASLSRSAGAQEEPKKKAQPEFPAAPKLLQPATIIIEPHHQRTDTREVWQHYGVNSQGRFVPRVINTPCGYYYSRDLQPYPWAGTRPRAFVP